MVWVNALVGSINGMVEAEMDAGKVDIMRIALIMIIKVFFFMIVFPPNLLMI